MALPEFSMRSLLEAGAHFGHQTHRWNPKMERYIFGSRSNIHIIDLSQSIPLLHQALVAVRDVAAKGGRVLFVGTKRQASDPVAEAAKRCAQYYMNNRWLGGTLTNWRTVSGSIARLRELEGILENGGEGRVKKELVNLGREKDKLELEKSKQQNTLIMFSCGCGCFLFACSLFQSLPGKEPIKRAKSCSRQSRTWQQRFSRLRTFFPVSVGGGMLATVGRTVWYALLFADSGRSSSNSYREHVESCTHSRMCGCH
jgi:hypothetical protein